MNEEQDSYELYLEDLKFKGVTIEILNETTLKNWYITYQDNLEEATIVEEYKLRESEDSFGSKEIVEMVSVTSRQEVSEIIQEQLQDDVLSLVIQLQFLTSEVKLIAQRLERLEDDIHNRTMKEVKS